MLQVLPQPMLIVKLPLQLQQALVPDSGGEREQDRDKNLHQQVRATRRPAISTVALKMTTTCVNKS
jgi:hypothetical protein